MKTDTASIIKFAQELIRTPSQGGIDSYATVVDLAYEFARAQGLPVVKLLDDKGEPVAVVAEIKGGQAKQQDLNGNFLMILDADEHTGRFEGIKAALKAGYKPDGIMIGYAGDDKIVAAHDERHHVPQARATAVEKISSEPPFLTPANSALRTALRESVEEITGKKVPEVIAGPSNIGNFLAKSGIEVTAGYGVPAKGVHANDERAQLNRLPKVYSVYRQTLYKLLKVTA